MEKLDGVSGTLRLGMLVVFADSANIATIEANDVPEFHYVPASTIAAAANCLV